MVAKVTNGLALKMFVPADRVLKANSEQFKDKDWFIFRYLRAAKVNKVPNLPFRISTYNYGCFHGKHRIFQLVVGLHSGFVPYLKIATYSELAKIKPHWTDYYTGPLTVNKPLDEDLAEMSDKIVRVASGEKAWHETSGFYPLVE